MARENLAGLVARTAPLTRTMCSMATASLLAAVIFPNIGPIGVVLLGLSVGTFFGILPGNW